jgi:hypothetical protein
MAKRFTDTGIWNKTWFRKLDPQDKTAMFYVLSNCDAVGVWDADTEAAEFFIGAAVEWDGLIQRSNGNLERLQNGKIFVVDFCEFQYGELSPDCKPHQAYIRLLEKHGLKNRITKGYPKGIHTLEEKEKEKEKEKEEEKEKDAPKFEVFYEAYPNKKSRKDAEKAWKSLKPSSELGAQIMAAIDDQKRERAIKAKCGLFVPNWKYPASWLRAEAWKDETMTDEDVLSESANGATKKTGNSNGRTHAPDADDYAILAKRLGID